MHKDEMKGAAKEAKGSMKEAAGKLTGNDRMRAEGAAEKTEGKVQKSVGSVKDEARFRTGPCLRTALFAAMVRSLFKAAPGLARP